MSLDIKITETALTKFSQFLKEEGCSHVRLGIKGGGCSGAQYNLAVESFVDDGSDENLCFQQGDVNFVVDIFSAEYLSGVTIDYKETLLESGFSFDNPNFERGCGCGKSFSI